MSSFQTRRAKDGAVAGGGLGASDERLRGFEVNSLTVIATESYEPFAERWQKEIEQHTSIRFGIVENFNADARRIVLEAAKAATSSVEAGGGWIDARLVQSPTGYAVPLANYSADVNKPVTLTLRGVEGVRKITSANRGELKLQREKDGSVRVTYTTGLGDILRIDTK